MRERLCKPKLISRSKDGCLPSQPAARRSIQNVRISESLCHVHRYEPAEADIGKKKNAKTDCGKYRERNIISIYPFDQGSSSFSLLEMQVKCRTLLCRSTLKITRGYTFSCLAFSRPFRYRVSCISVTGARVPIKREDEGEHPEVGTSFLFTGGSPDG